MGWGPCPAPISLRSSEGTKAESAWKAPAEKTLPHSQPLSQSWNSRGVSGPDSCCLQSQALPVGLEATPSKIPMGLTLILTLLAPKNPLTPRQHHQKQLSGQPGTNLPSPGPQATRQPQAGPRLPASQSSLWLMIPHVHTLLPDTHTWCTPPGSHAF